MDSIIKWPGGKSSEYKYIKDIIPEYDRYVEPFLGGGAVFFKEEPENAILNDFNKDLIEFYSLIKNNNTVFFYYLEELLDIRHKILQFSKKNEKNLILLFKKLIHQKLNNEDLKVKIKVVLNDNYNFFNTLFKQNEIINQDKLFKEINIRLAKKIIRVNKIVQKDKKKFTEQDLRENITTGFMGGLYYHLRDIYNEERINRKSLCKEKYYAVYYFIREFCYGSMFRFNKDGGFNVPYGGNSYNRKSFENKIKKVYKAQNSFSNSKLYNLDFEDFFNEINFKKEDFIFLDPPYDSKFSTYGENVFDRSDHERLEKSLRNIKAKFLMIIKNTEFIYGLYNKEDYYINSFIKQYSANIKNRNDRDVKHLIIKNYK